MLAFIWDPAWTVLFLLRLSTILQWVFEQIPYRSLGLGDILSGKRSETGRPSRAISLPLIIRRTAY